MRRSTVARSHFIHSPVMHVCGHEEYHQFVRRRDNTDEVREIASNLCKSCREQQKREEFCQVNGHNYTTWLPKQGRIDHKRCTYCGFKA